MRNRIPLLALLGLAGLFLYSTGCDSASNPVAPTGSVLTVTANPTFVGLTGSSTITVSGFKPDGNPLNPGTQINLSTSQGTIPSLVEADSTGRATATFTADERVGTATITASLPGNEATATATVEIGEQKPVLEISANPTSIPLTGRSTITVVVRDFNGFTVADAGPIILTATNGTIPREATSGGNGVATATFRASEDPSGDGEVRAFFDNSDTVSVTITIRDLVEIVNLTANPDIIDRVDSPGVDVTLTAIVQNSLGTPAPSIQVTFATDKGVLSEIVVPTNSQGQAVSTLTVTSVDVVAGEVFQVRASVRNEETTTTKTADIMVRPDPP